MVNIRYRYISYKQAIFKVPKGSLKKSDPEPRLSGRPKGTKKRTRLVFTINQVDAALVLGLSSFLDRLYPIHYIAELRVNFNLEFVFEFL